MDSIRQEVKEYYSKRVEIKDLSSDQDTNDLEKSINYALSLHGKKIVCLGALGGRFDQ
jgi:thiamine pyrophosphokinase